jgi:Rad3-related DNA helicase
MICDRRLVTKSYGKRMLQSLPPMKMTRSAAEAGCCELSHANDEIRAIHTTSAHMS